MKGNFELAAGSHLDKPLNTSLIDFEPISKTMKSQRNAAFFQTCQQNLATIHCTTPSHPIGNTFLIIPNCKYTITSIMIYTNEKLRTHLQKRV